MRPINRRIQDFTMERFSQTGAETGGLRLRRPTEEAEAKCELGIQFLTFSFTKFRILKEHRSRDSTLLLCKHTVKKNSKDSMGV